MQLWKSILAYDGTPFHGWQVQPGLPTVQGALAHALHHITGEQVLPQGSGRTDTGVHALAQVATFTLAAPIPPANLLRALNRALPPAVRVLSVTHALQQTPPFHARHSALRKTYEYRLFPRNPGARDQPDHICPPFLAPYVWDYPFPFNFKAAAEAASHILGTHDFTSFAAADPDLTTRSAFHIPTQEARVPHSSQLHRDEWENTPSPSSRPSPPFSSPTPNTRTIFQSSWTHDPAANLFLYRVTGSGFLHHMVRNLVGTFTDAASNRIPPSAIPEILAARNRSAAGPTAPARGLFLVQVDYPADYPAEYAEAEPR